MFFSKKPTIAIALTFPLAWTLQGQGLSDSYQGTLCRWSTLPLQKKLKAPGVQHHRGSATTFEGGLGSIPCRLADWQECASMRARLAGDWKACSKA